MKNLFLTLAAAFAAFFVFGAPAQAQTSCGAPSQWMCTMTGLNETNPVGGAIYPDNSSTQPTSGSQTDFGEVSDHAESEICGIVQWNQSFCEVDRWDADTRDASEACGGGGSNAGVHGDLDGLILCKRHVAGGGQSWYLQEGPSSNDFTLITPR